MRRTVVSNALLPDAHLVSIATYAGQSCASMFTPTRLNSWTEAKADTKAEAKAEDKPKKKTTTTRTRKKKEETEA